MTTTALQLHTHRGNTKRFLFVVSEFGSTGPWDLSGASTILWEFTDQRGVELAPHIVQPDALLADWANGHVVVESNPQNVSGVVGSYQFSLTVWIDGKERTVLTGQIEVHARAGYPVPNQAHVVAGAAVTVIGGTVV